MKKIKVMLLASTMILGIQQDSYGLDDVYVLSIDGGGTRGIMPAKILDFIEQEVQDNVGKLVKKDIHEILGEPLNETIPNPNIHLAKGFDLMAGTSTGGIIVLGLSKKDPKVTDCPQYRPSDLFSLYKTKSGEIFPPTKFYGVLSPTYSPKGIEKILGDYFNDSRLSEAITNLLIVSYRLKEQRAYSFMSDCLVDKNVHMRDVARATSAAPIYFPAASLEGNHGLMVDGGISYNNPAWLAYEKAKKDFPNHRIVLLSLGTGKSDPLSIEPLQNAGLKGWGVPLLSVIMNNGSEFIHDLLEKEKKRNDSVWYIRIQPTLQPGQDVLDNSTAPYLDKLTNIATQHIKIPNISATLHGFIHNFSQKYFQREKVFIFPLRNKIKQALLFGGTRFYFENYNIDDVTAWEINAFFKKGRINPDTLDLKNNKITYQGFKLLVNGLNSIQRLNLSMNNINSKINITQPLNNLTELNLDSQKNKEKIGSGIRNIVPLLPNLQTLSVSNNNISDSDAIFLKDYLTKLNTLNISRNLIGHDGAKILVTSFNLEKLNLSYNSVHVVMGVTDGIKTKAGVFGGFFGATIPLTHLDLSYNHVTDVEFEDLSNVLDKCTLLHRLNLKEKEQDGKAPIQNKELLNKHKNHKLLGEFAQWNLEFNNGNGSKTTSPPVLPSRL